jgi:hypothetical protein
MRIFQQEGIIPTVFVALAHSFNKITLRLLPKYGLSIISDGFSRFSFISPEGVFWISQQICDFVEKRSGIWTICVHNNTDCKKEDIAELRRWLDRFQSQMTYVEEVVKQYSNRPQVFNDRLFAWYYFTWYYMIKRTCGRFLRVIYLAGKCD